MEDVLKQTDWTWQTKRYYKFLPISKRNCSICLLHSVILLDMYASSIRRFTTRNSSQFSMSFSSCSCSSDSAAHRRYLKFLLWSVNRLVLSHLCSSRSAGWGHKLATHCLYLGDWLECSCSILCWVECFLFTWTTYRLFKGFVLSI